VKDESESTSPKFNPVKEMTFTAKQKPMLTTPKSLNPFALEFETRVFPRSEESYYIAEISDPPNKSSVEDSLTRLADILSKRRLQDSLPLPEPDVFKTSFKTIIQGLMEKVSQLLYYLGKYKAGELKQAISGPLLLETVEAYEQPKILSDPIGNPFLTSNAYQKKINEWTKIPLNHGTILHKFSAIQRLIH